MKHFRAFALIAAGILSFLSPGASAWEEEKVLRVFNWSDYIAPYTILNFEQETGIKVFYDIYDSNEVLDEKVMKGNTGYDLVVPGSDFLAKQIKAGVYRKLDKDNIPNWKNLDPVQMLGPGKKGHPRAGLKGPIESPEKGQLSRNRQKC